MIWSYSLPWYGGFRQLDLDDNRIMAGLKFKLLMGSGVRVRNPFEGCLHI